MYGKVFQIILVISYLLYYFSDEYRLLYSFLKIIKFNFVDLKLLKHTVHALVIINNYRFTPKFHQTNTDCDRTRLINSFEQFNLVFQNIFPSLFSP